MTKKFVIPSREELENLYINERQSPNQIAALYHVSRPTVKKWLIENRITIRSFDESVLIVADNQKGSQKSNKKEAHFLLSNYDWLYEQRVINKKSKEDIATTAGCSTNLVNKYLNKLCLNGGRVNLAEKYKDILTFEYLTEKYTIQGMKIREIANELGISHNVVFQAFTLHKIQPKPVNYYDRPFHRISKDHQEIIDYIKENYSGDMKINCRKFGVEFDIYLPELNFAIEYNGLFFHSENGGKNRKYHLNKTLVARGNGIFLFHIFSDQWNEKKAIVKSMILNKLGKISHKMYARKCEIRSVERFERMNFFANNHIQGEDKAELSYGLYYNDRLISCMSFGQSRFNKKYKWELVRFANIISTSTVGGFSKLLKYFREHHDGSIVSYSDRSYSEGKIYESNGFFLDKINNPNYKYLDSSCEKRFFKNNFRKKILKAKYDDIDMKETESEITKKLGFNRIWDCGTIRWVLQ